MKESIDKAEQFKRYVSERISVLETQKSYLESEIRKAIESEDESMMRRFGSQLGAIDRTISELYLVLQQIEEIFE